jgi:hypothetical protein
MGNDTGRLGPPQPEGFSSTVFGRVRSWALVDWLRQHVKPVA